MRKRFISLEGHGDEPDFSEDDTSTGTDPADPTLTDDPEDPPTEDIPEDGGLSTTDGVDGLDSSTDADEEKEKEEKANAEVTLTDVTDLGVDDLADQAEAKDRKDLKKEIKEETTKIEAYQDDLIVLNEACESLRRISIGLKADRGQEMDTLYHMRCRYQLPSIRPALEDSNKSKQYGIAAEGFKETIKLVIDKILQAIGRVFEYIRKLIRHFFDRNTLIRSSIQKAHAALMDMHSKKGADLASYLQRRAIDTNRYISDSSMVRAKLSTNGRFINDIQLDQFDQNGNRHGTANVSGTEMLHRSIKVINQPSFFVSNESKLFVAGLSKVVKNMEALNFSSSDISKMHPALIVQDDAHRVSSIEGYVCPAGKFLIVSDGYLGDIAITSEFAANRDDNDLLSCLDYVADWKQGSLQVYRETANGFLPKLGIDEIKELTTGALSINAAVEDLRGAADKYEALTKDVKAAMEAAKAAVRNEISENITREDVFRQHCFVAATKAAMSWLRNSQEAFDLASFHGYHVQLAWAKFLALTINQDAIYIKAMNTQS